MFKSLTLLLFCYVHRSHSAYTDVLAKAFYLPGNIDSSTYTNINQSLVCFKENNYQTGFVNVYFGNEFLSDIFALIGPMQQNNISIQYVAMPASQNASDIVGQIKNGLSSIGVSLDYLWIDISLLCQGGRAPDNVKLLIALSKLVRIGIKTSYTQWLDCTNNYDGPDLNNPIVWWEQSNENIYSFNLFPFFGVWQKASVVSAYEMQTCLSINNTLSAVQDLVYRIDDLKNELSTTAAPKVVNPTENPNSFGNGIMLTIREKNASFSQVAKCLSKYYDTCFLSIYRTSQVDYYSTYVIPDLLNAGLPIQPVITTDFLRAAEHILDDTLRVMANYNIPTNIVWINTVYLYSGVEKTIPFLTDMSNLLKRRGITMGVMTTSIPWIEYTNDWQVLAQNGAILWDRTEIANFGTYIPFGGWSVPDSYSQDQIDFACDDESVNAFVDVGKYRRQVVNPITRPPTTPSAPTTTAAKSFSDALYIVYDSQLDFDNTQGTLECLRRTGYRAVFLEIYHSYDLDAILMNSISQLYAEGFQVYLTIAPSVLTTNGAHIAISNIKAALSAIGFETNFFFYDTANYLDGNIEWNLAGLNNVLLAAQAQNISLGIFTDPSIWSEMYNSSTAFSSLPLSVKGLQDFDYFVPLAGWQSAAAATYGTVNQCVDPLEFTRFKYAFYYPNQLSQYALRAIDPNFTTFSIPTLTTPRPNTTTGNPITTSKPLTGTVKPTTTSGTSSQPITTPSPTRDPSVGSGLVMSSDGPSVPLNLSCVTSNGYETVFLQIYQQYDLNYDLTNQTYPMKNAGLNVQYVVQPDFAFQKFTPEYEVDLIVQLFQAFIGIYPEFLWIDTSVLGNSSTNNIDYLNRFIIRCSAATIQTGILAIPEVWKTGMNNYNRPSSFGRILWDQSMLSGFDQFSSFGGWNSTSVIPTKNANKCPPQEIRLKVSDVLYKKADLDFSTHTTANTIDNGNKTTVTSTTMVSTTTVASTTVVSTSTVYTTTSECSVLVVIHIFLFALSAHFL